MLVWSSRITSFLKFWRSKCKKRDKWANGGLNYVNDGRTLKFKWWDFKLIDSTLFIEIIKWIILKI